MDGSHQRTSWGHCSEEWEPVVSSTTGSCFGLVWPYTKWVMLLRGSCREDVEDEDGDVMVILRWSKNKESGSLRVSYHKPTGDVKLCNIHWSMMIYKGHRVFANKKTQLSTRYDTIAIFDCWYELTWQEQFCHAGKINSDMLLTGMRDFLRLCNLFFGCCASNENLKSSF